MRWREQNGKCRYRLSMAKVRDTGFVNIAYGDERKLMETVATVGPVSAAIDASQSSFRFYDSGITLSPYQRWKWVSGSWVTAIDPLTHDDEITFFVLR